MKVLSKRAGVFRTIGDTWRQMREDAPKSNWASRLVFDTLDTGVRGFQIAREGMEKTLDAYVPTGEGVRYNDGRNRRAHGQGPNWDQAFEASKDLWGGAGRMALAGASVVPVRLGGNLATRILPSWVPRFLGGGGARALVDGMGRWSPFTRSVAGKVKYVADKGMNVLGHTAEALFSPGVSASRLANWAAVRGGTNPFVRSVDWALNRAPVLRHLQRLGQRTLGDGSIVATPYGRQVWQSFVQRPLRAIPTHLGKTLASSALGPGNLFFGRLEALDARNVHDSYYGPRDDWGMANAGATAAAHMLPYALVNSPWTNLAVLGLDKLMDNRNRETLPYLGPDGAEYLQTHGRLPTQPVSWGQRLFTPSNRDRIPGLTQQSIDRLPPDLGALVAHRGTYSAVGREILAFTNHLLNQGYPPEDVYQHVREVYGLPPR